jgi:Holliday junction resolvase-like predicted endonuclease
VSRQLGSIGNSNGDVAEEYFQNAFKKNPTLNGEIFNEIDFNLKLSLKKGQISSEYDIVMVNKKSVAIIEIKYHFELKKADLQNVLSKLLNKIETFKAFYPEYKKHKFYLGIASLSFRKNIEKIIQGTGIAIIKQVGDKMVINSENLKAF